MYTKYLHFVQEVVSGLTGGEPDSAKAERLARWVAQVADWNRRIDLTAARDDRELVDLLVADAAVLAARVAGPRVVDVGSGAGAPGLALAALRPELELTLVEPMQKRGALLRLTAGGWPDGRVTVLQARGEQLVREGRRFDVAVSRATLPPPEWLRLGAALGEHVWVLLAREPAPELPGWQVAEEVAYQWPLTGASRRALRFAAVASGS
jgi:16S rRNA (guanine527-N7)-methyltransferase